MDLYIDKANLQSFIASKGDSLFQDCLKLLKKQLNIQFNFDKSEFIKEEQFRPLIPVLTEGVGDSMPPKWNVSFPERPLKSNTHNSFTSDQLSAIYFLDDEKIDIFKDAGAVAVAKPGEEVELFGKMFLDQNDYLFEKDLRIGSDEFSCWNDISCYALPLTDLVIIDPYLLKKQSESTDEIEENLLSFIDSICLKSKSKINVVIVLAPSNIDYDLNEVKNRIKIKIKEITGKKSEITFVKTSKEHDRTIITNYLRYSGNSFTYFANGKKVTKGKDLNIKSGARLDNHNKMKEALKDVQDIIDFALQNDGVEGDQKSGFLHFN